MAYLCQHQVLHSTFAILLVCSRRIRGSFSEGNIQETNRNLLHTAFSCACSFSCLVFTHKTDHLCIMNSSHFICVVIAHLVWDEGTPIHKTTTTTINERNEEPIEQGKNHYPHINSHPTSHNWWNGINTTYHIRRRMDSWWCFIFLHFICFPITKEAKKRKYFSSSRCSMFSGSLYLLYIFVFFSEFIHCLHCQPACMLRLAVCVCVCALRSGLLYADHVSNFWHGAHHLF